MSSNISGDTLYNILKNVRNNYNSDIFSDLDLNRVGSGIEANVNALNNIFDRNLGSNVSINDVTAKLNIPNISNSPNILGVVSDNYDKFNTNSAPLIINYKNNIKQDKNKSYNVLNKPAKSDTYDKISGEFNPTIENIVDNSSTLQALKLNYSDFLYCKRLNAYPNNRLVILRRFNSGAADNIIDADAIEMNTSQTPISVMVTWFDEFPVNISFKEEWTTIETGLIKEIMNTGKELLGEGAEEYADQNYKEDISNPFLSAIWFSIIAGQDDNAKYDRILPGANPNLIRQAVYRKAMSLKSDITMTLKFEYVLRYLNGIDPHIAMHNIIANIIRMGTSTSISVYERSALTDFTNDVLTDIVNGHITTALKKLIEKVTDYLSTKNDNNESCTFGGDDNKTNITDQKTSPISPGTTNKSKKSSLELFLCKVYNNLTSNIEEVASNYVSKVLSIYRFRLLAALKADTGLPSGQWHVTIGNPFNPIVTIGDLILSENIKLSFNKELSYNDFPTEIYATVQLKSARTRGAQEIEKIFNGGRGRIYTYPNDFNNPDFFYGESLPETDVTNTTDSNKK